MTPASDEKTVLVAGGIVVTMDKDSRVIENGAVLVSGDRIMDVGGVAELKKNFRGTVVDASGCLVMPGLVNAHTHLPMSLFRGLADDLPLMVWLNEHMFPAEAAHIRPETVYLGALLSCAEMLLSGTTCCCDGYFHEESVAKAVAEAGMRGILGQGVIDFSAPGVSDPSRNVDEAARFVKSIKGKYDRIEPSIFCHSPYTCSDETLKKAKQAAREHGVLFQVHVAETDGEREQSIEKTGLSPVAYLESLDVLDDRTLLIHVVAVDEHDFAIIKQSGASVAHAPESNMKLASGVAPVPDMLAMGIPMGLGTDGSASNNDLDLFGDMSTAARLHKVIRKDPTVMSAETVLRMATSGGAEALGLGRITGSLESGKKADLIVVNMRKPHLIPMYCPMSHLVYSVRGSDVRDVMVDGQMVVADGILLTVDVDRLMDEVMALSGMIGKRR
ncbi:MAG: amidohydrolase [Desulfobacteraceae bacterium]|jgi:5-methylthioadenosine/S-adenosylhomocysteine deaminase